MGQRHQGLPRPRHPVDRHDLDGVVEEEVKGEELLLVPGEDPPDPLLEPRHQADPPPLGLGPDQRRLRGSIGGVEDQELVRVDALEVVPGGGAALVDRVDHRAGDQPLDHPGVHLVDVDLRVLIVLSGEPDGVALEPHVGVAGHQGHVPELPLERPSALQDAVVCAVRPQIDGELVEVMDQLDPELPTLVIDQHTVAQRALPAQVIEDPRHGPGVPPRLVHVLLEAVDLLDDRDRDHDEVLIKGEDRLGIVEQHVGVDHEGPQAVMGLAQQGELSLGQRPTPR
jgi:hypothetical protein